MYPPTAVLNIQYPSPLFDFIWYVYCTMYTMYRITHKGLYYKDDLKILYDDYPKLILSFCIEYRLSMTYLMIWLRNKLAYDAGRHELKETEAHTFRTVVSSELGT